MYVTEKVRHWYASNSGKFDISTSFNCGKFYVGSAFAVQGENLIMVPHVTAES
jgi:hypothetical protein